MEISRLPNRSTKAKRPELISIDSRLAKSRLPNRSHSQEHKLIRSNRKFIFAVTNYFVSARLLSILFVTNRFETGKESASQQITRCQEHTKLILNIRYQPIRDWQWVGFPTNYSVSRTHKIDMLDSVPLGALAHSLLDTIRCQYPITRTYVRTTSSVRYSI